METKVNFWNPAIVFLFGLVYWTGVWVQARRIRKRIGRSPNVKPRGLKERFLWTGWFLVIAAWLVLPFLSRMNFLWVQPIPIPTAWGLPVFALGAFLMLAGYAGTLWCYLALGDAWRMGVVRSEKPRLVTHGPYRFVRHPIYLCQLVMVAAVVVLLPSVVSLAAMGLHLVCVLLKASDEEAYLRDNSKPEGEDYLARTGKWIPRWPRPKSFRPQPMAAGQGDLKPTGQLTEEVRIN